MVDWAMLLSDVSETAPADTCSVMASPTVVFWLESRVAVIVLPEWLFVVMPSSVTLPFTPASLSPE